MSATERAQDYYAILQVHPTADQEVIEAAYRQLMKKYHPDRAGDDAATASVLHERAKLINQAYMALREPSRRYAYDAQRSNFGSVSAPQPPKQPTARPTPSAAWVPEYDAQYVREVIAYEHRPWAPIAALATAYYLLPGRYEWDHGRGRDLLATFLIPPIGLMGWALASGHLVRLLGTAPLANVGAWIVLGLASLPLWQVLPRLLLAVGPSLLLASGVIGGYLAQSHVPAWAAWSASIIVGLIISPRLFLFAALPTIIVSAALAHFS